MGSAVLDSHSEIPDHDLAIRLDLDQVAPQLGVGNLVLGLRLLVAVEDDERTAVGRRRQSEIEPAETVTADVVGAKRPLLGLGRYGRREDVRPHPHPPQNIEVNRNEFLGLAESTLVRSGAGYASLGKRSHIHGLPLAFDFFRDELDLPASHQETKPLRLPDFRLVSEVRFTVVALDEENALGVVGDLYGTFHDSTPSGLRLYAAACL